MYCPIVPEPAALIYATQGAGLAELAPRSLS
jgi:hypothetical protein